MEVCIYTNPKTGLCAGDLYLLFSYGITRKYVIKVNILNIIFMLARSPPFSLFCGEVLYANESEKWTMILVKMLFKHL